MLIDFLVIFCTIVLELDGAYDHILSRENEDGRIPILHIVVNNILNSFLIRFNNYCANEQHVSNKRKNTNKVHKNTLLTQIKTLGDKLRKNKSSTRLPSDVGILVRDELAPEPVLFPNKVHLLNGYTFCFREEDIDKHSHDNDPSSKEEKETELHYTKHLQEQLAYEEGEEHVH